MKLRYTRRARRQLDNIQNYIAERNPAAARRVMTRIRETVQMLDAFPSLGHQGLIPSTREMKVTGLPYVVVHRIEDDVLVILGVYHCAQNRGRDEH